MTSAASRRTDDIRLRRKNRANKQPRKSKGGRRQYESRTSPPVMSRYTLVGGEQAKGKRTRKTRPRIDLPLDAQGAEMRLPAFPRFRLGWRLISITMGILLAYLLYSLWNSPTYQVDTVEIYGLKRLDHSTVSSVLDADGQQIFMVDAADKNKELLDAFPEFSEVEVQVVLPNSVVLTVTERVPVLLWRQDGRSTLVDMDGMTFPMRDESQASSYPVVEASDTPPSPFVPKAEGETEDIEGETVVEVEVDQQKAQPFMTPEMVSAVLALVKLAPEGANLIYDSHHGVGWEDPRGWNVFFGEFTAMESKLIVYEAILEHLKAQDTRPTLISVEYLHAPYFRLME